jgi:L-asparaginase II
MPVELAHVMRGEVLESVHFGDIVVADTAGAGRYVAGEADRYVFYRSSAKPLQALAVIVSGAAERFGFGDPEIALCCASHCGSQEHTAIVSGMLERIGRYDTDLQCGIHPPDDSAERARLAATGEAPGPRHNNCSGKHAGMLAACLALGADISTYLELSHPLQQMNLRHIAELSRVAPEDIKIAEDGCGAPTFALPLRGIATSFARLASPEGLSPELVAAAEWIRRAMLAFPHLVGARDTFAEKLMGATYGEPVAPKHIVLKGGAEGLICAGLPEQGLGIAIKISDGSHRAHPPLLLEVLRRLGVLDPQAEAAMGPYIAPIVTNAHGHTVGAIRAVLP